MPFFKTSLLLLFSAISFILLCYITINNQHEKSYIVNEVKNSKLISDSMPNIFNETNNSTKLYQTDITLTNLTIIEKTNYKITDFIQSINNLPAEITYEYTLPEMNNYYLPGTYLIKITFKDNINNTLEKEANLTILKNQQVNKPKPKTSSNTNKSTNTDNNISIENRILNDSKKLGDSGRIFFESLYSIALYEPTSTEEAQEYVDNKDSGAIIEYPNISIIADHASQGFDIIKKEKIGNYIYIKNPNKTIDTNVIKEKTNGYNTKDKLLTEDGRNIILILTTHLLYILVIHLMVIMLQFFY